MLGMEARPGSEETFVPHDNAPTAFTEIAAGVIHDLGNLIQIATSAVTILAGNPRVHTTDLEPVLAGARTSLERAGVLVRRTAGVMRERSPSFEYVSLADCLEDIKALTRISWVHQLNATISSDVPPVRCDRLSLENALLNLLFNARDAMPDGGVIYLQAAAVSDEAGTTFVELRVTDSGIGMKPETIERAFEPFFTTKPDGLGGIGLPMVRRFADEAGGDVSIESAFGVGTTVMLRLPAPAESASASPSSPRS